MFKNAGKSDSEMKQGTVKEHYLNFTTKSMKSCFVMIIDFKKIFWHKNTIWVKYFEYNEFGSHIEQFKNPGSSLQLYDIQRAGSPWGVTVIFHIQNYNLILTREEQSLQWDGRNVCGFSTFVLGFFFKKKK